MKQIVALFVLMAASSWLSATTPIIPNTTFANEIGNNTSAAATFQSQSNGNLGATNISKAQIKSLLYPGFTGKVYVHFMPWFGGTNHMNVGYESNNATQVANQVTDMMSRGIDGAIVDWYGPNSARADGTTKLLRAEAEKRNGKFQFAITEDKGALKSCAATAGCDITGQMISDLTYAYNIYETSSAYIQYNGRPVVFFFGVEAYSIDWARVIASVPGNPLFIQRNSGAFSNPVYSGAFAWPSPTANPADIGDTYLDNFYNAGRAHPTDLAYATGYKGFNDLLAAWTANRIMNQNCGQTFLNTFAQIATYYSVNQPLFAVQLATWNDYEEGTELESGIDNCVSIQATSAGKSVSWSITGNANMVDHYTVFISTDGTNLMSVADVPASQSSYDFTGYALATGSYTVYVKAVGAAFMSNHMSGAVALSIDNLTPTAKLAVTASSSVAPATVTASAAASTDPDGYIARTTIDFGDGTVLSGVTASHTYSKAGSYTVTATVTDNDGASVQASTSISLAAPAPTAAPLSSGVSVSSPAPNSTIVGAVKFVASAKAANPITAMRIYVDCVSKYLTNAATINTTLTLAKGTRAVTVQAWDSKGTVYKSSLRITVK
jgi:PKD repeat protein